MHVKQQEHLQLSKFLFIDLKVIKIRWAFLFKSCAKGIW